MHVAYSATFVLSALLGFAEHISRYRDSPGALLSTPAAYLYLLLNGLIGCGALYLLTVFPISDAATLENAAANEAQRLVYNVLIAGLGGAALLRSSVARTKVGDTEVAIGPAFVIEAFLTATDRAVDRSRAIQRTREITESMRKVPSHFAADALYKYCSGAMQNLSAAEQEYLDKQIGDIVASSVPSGVKSMLIGFTLGEIFGPVLLVQSVNILEPEIDAARSAQQTLEAELDEAGLEAAMAAAPDDGPGAGVRLEPRAEG